MDANGMERTYLMYRELSIKAKLLSSKGIEFQGWLTMSVQDYIKHCRQEPWCTQKRIDYMTKKGDDYNWSNNTILNGQNQQEYFGLLDQIAQ